MVDEETVVPDDLLDKLLGISERSSTVPRADRQTLAEAF